MNANSINKNKAFISRLAVMVWVISMIFGWQWSEIELAYGQTDASVSILTSSFYEKQPAQQKQLLRQLTLFPSNDALIFFCQVALDQRVDTDVRRDALKSILAMDSTVYRAALMPLAQPGLNNQVVIDALTLLPVNNIGYSWLASIDWEGDTESIITQKLTQGYRSLENVEAIRTVDLQAWNKIKANIFLKNEIRRSKVEQEPFWLGLLAWVSNSKDAGFFKTKLTHPVLEIRQAAVYGLTRPGGPRNYDAVLTTLQKEAKTRLPVKMMGYLVEDGSDQARKTAEQFAKKLPAKEKTWVLAQWP